MNILSLGPLIPLLQLSVFFVFSFFRSPASLLSSPLSLFQKSVDIAHLLVALACAYDLCFVAFMLIAYGE